MNINKIMLIKYINLISKLSAYKLLLLFYN